MPSAGQPPTLFATTCWTLVVDAARGSETAAVDALGELVRTYWPPLYRYARRKDKSKEDAEDLVQGFMMHLIEARSLDSADRDKGRFRALDLIETRVSARTKERRFASAGQPQPTSPEVNQS